MRAWLQKYPPISSALIDTLLYVGAYLLAFQLVLFLKALLYPPAAWGAVNIASSLLFPVAFLAVGYYRGGWRLTIGLLIILLGARVLLATRIAELAKFMGHERAFSAIWPSALPWVTGLGIAVTTLHRIARKRQD